jgi:hypothetical protein
MMMHGTMNVKNFYNLYLLPTSSNFFKFVAGWMSKVSQIILQIGFWCTVLVFLAWCTTLDLKYNNNNDNSNNKKLIYKYNRNTIWHVLKYKSVPVLRLTTTKTTGTTLLLSTL